MPRLRSACLSRTPDRGARISRLGSRGPEAGPGTGTALQGQGETPGARQALPRPVAQMLGAWGIGMMVMMFGFWAVVVTGIVLAFRWLARQGGGGGPDRALQILRERYARGEIDKQEFDARRRDLS